MSVKIVVSQEGIVLSQFYLSYPCSSFALPQSQLTYFKSSLRQIYLQYHRSYIEKFFLKAKWIVPQVPQTETTPRSSSDIHQKGCSAFHLLDKLEPCCQCVEGLALLSAPATNPIVCNVCQQYVLQYGSTVSAWEYATIFKVLVIAVIWFSMGAQRFGISILRSQVRWRQI